MRNLLKYYREVLYPDIALSNPLLLESKVREQVEQIQVQKKSSFRFIENAFVARLGNEVVGFFDCSDDHDVTDGQILISNLCIKKSMQGKGLGQDLTKEAIKYCKTAGKDLILTVYKDDLAAFHIYKKLGFQVIDLIADPPNPFLFFNKVMMRYQEP